MVNCYRGWQWYRVVEVAFGNRDLVRLITHFHQVSDVHLGTSSSTTIKSRKDTKETVEIRLESTMVVTAANTKTQETIQISHFDMKESG